MSTEDVFKMIFLILLIKISIGSNLLVCLAIATCKKLRNAFNYLVVSLAVADMLVGIVVIPSYCFFIIKGSVRYTGNGFYAYAVYICFDIFTGIASIINITVMSIDRAVLLFSPQQHKRTLAQSRNVVKVIMAVWLFAALMVLIKILEYKSHIGHTSVVITYFLLGFLIPMIIIAVSYVYIFAKQAKDLQRCSLQLKKDLRLAYITLVIVVVFFLCWAPFFGVMMYHSFCNPCQNIHGLTIFSKWMQFFHSCCNPIIYAVLQPSLRGAFKRLLARIIPCCMTKPNNLDEQVEMTTEQFPMSDATNDGLKFTHDETAVH